MQTRLPCKAVEERARGLVASTEISSIAMIHLSCDGERGGSMQLCCYIIQSTGSALEPWSLEALI